MNQICLSALTHVRVEADILEEMCLLNVRTMQSGKNQQLYVHVSIVVYIYIYI